MKNLPPLRSLVAFEVAARHLSFSKAAEELHVTPGAVGQLIHKLEDWLGVELFHRQVRRVTLSDEGAAYLGRISAALGQIAQASSALKQRRRNEVRISLPPSFAAKWFAPRMARFLELHPEVSLQVTATQAFTDFDRDPVDLAIRHSVPPQSGDLEVELLFHEEVRVYCSRHYRAALKLKRPADLARATLLVTTVHRHWQRWFREFTPLSGGEVGAIPTIGFNQLHLAVDAARRHQGVVLTDSVLVGQEASSSELVELFEARLAVEEGYYLLSPRNRLAAGEAVESLRVWLRQEAARRLLPAQASDGTGRRRSTQLLGPKSATLGAPKR